MKKILLLLAMVGMLAVACEPGGGVEDEDGNQTEQPGGNDTGSEDAIPTDKIVITPTSMEVGVEANDYVVAVSSPCSWRATTENEWITIETKLGIDGKRELIFSVADYWETEPREGEIVVANSDEGLSAELIVTQKAFEPEWSIDVETLVFNGEAGEQTIEIAANFMGGFQATTDADWITFRYTNNSVIVRVAAPSLAAQRTAEITISHNKYDLQPIKVNIVQETASQNRVILYESSNGQIVTPNKSDVFGANIVSNTYENGRGVIVFDAPVTSIGKWAFSDCTSLTSITIPNSVTSIGYRAFSGCTSLNAFYGKFASSDNGCLIVDGVLHSFAPAGLTEYTIPDSVTSIGDYAFYYCSRLTSVTIPDSVTSIGDYAFYNCTGELIINSKIVEINYGENDYDYRGWLSGSKFTKLTIGNSVTSIGKRAFYRCYSLTSVTIGNSVTSIGDYAFSDCTSLTSVTIPDSVTSIGNSAFYACSSLSSITIPEGVTSIGKWAFSRCTSLTSIAIPDSITSIGDYAFYLCTSLTSVTIPDSVTSIGNSAFYGCTALTSITIPDSVTSIGDDAFSSCTSLTSITIPDSVTSIGNGAFEDCTSLKEVYCKPTTPPSGGSCMFSYYNSGYKPIGCTIYVPTASVNAYKSASYWSEYADYIEGYDF